MSVNDKNTDLALSISCMKESWIVEFLPIAGRSIGYESAV